MSKSKDDAIAYVVRRDDGVFWDTWNDKWDDQWDAPLEDTVFDETVTPKEIVRDNGGRVVALGELPEPVEVTEEEAAFISGIRTSRFFRQSAVIREYAAVHDLDEEEEERIIRAYVDGYKVVRTKRYNVKVPGKFKRETFYALKGGKLAFGRFDKAMIQDYDPHPFTMKEIERYGLEDCERVEVPEDDAD